MGDISPRFDPFFRAHQGAMNQEQVNIIESKILQRLFNFGSSAVRGMSAALDLCREKDLGPGNLGLLVHE